MMTEAEERWILDQAYDPEHIVSLMKSLSGGEPCLIDEFLCFFRKDWLMAIGYALPDSMFWDQTDETAGSHRIGSRILEP